MPFWCDSCKVFYSFPCAIHKMAATNFWCDNCKRMSAVPEIHEDCGEELVRSERRYKNPFGFDGTSLQLNVKQDIGVPIESFRAEDYDFEIIVTRKFKPGWFRLLDSRTRSIKWFTSKPSTDWRRVKVEDDNGS
jgi:hypothetical protein